MNGRGTQNQLRVLRGALGLSAAKQIVCKQAIHRLVWIPIRLAVGGKDNWAMNLNDLALRVPFFGSFPFLFRRTMISTVLELVWRWSIPQARARRSLTRLLRHWDQPQGSTSSGWIVASTTLFSGVSSASWNGFREACGRRSTRWIGS